jgi:hypothetical protein
MRVRNIAWTALVVTLSSLAAVDIDLSDFEDERMEAMDESIKTLEEIINVREGVAAPADFEVLHQGLKWTEEYFAGKSIGDATELARKGQESVTTLSVALAANDFDAAFVAYRSLRRSCRNCHDLYKPPSL